MSEFLIDQISTLGAENMPKDYAQLLAYGDKLARDGAGRKGGRKPGRMHGHDVLCKAGLAVITCKTGVQLTLSNTTNER